MSAKSRYLELAGVALLVLAPEACRSRSNEGSYPRDAAPTSTFDAESIATNATPDASAERDAASLAPLGAICVPPLAGDFERCPKGAMAGDDRLRDCLRREKESPPKKPTFQIGGAPSSTFSSTHWRCVEVPLETKTHVTIDTLAGLDETVSSSCESHAIDMVGPNQYGAIFFRCSRRGRENDEIVPRE